MCVYDRESITNSRSPTDNLNLDVDLHELLGQRVDLDEAGIDGAREAAEARDEADVSLMHRLVGVRAEDAAGDGPEQADGRTERIDWDVRTSCASACVSSPEVSVAYE